MVLKADQERVKTLLKDTITLLCKNGLSFKSKFNVQALIGVTLDDSDVFLVDINEIVRSEKAVAGDASSRDDSSSEEEYVKSRKPNIKNRRSRSPQDDRQNKRAKVVNQSMQQKHQLQQPLKRDLHTSEEDEEDEEEERMMAMNMEHGMMIPKPEDMWDEEEDDEEDPDSLSGSFDDSNSQFPPEVLHNRIPPQHLHQQHLQRHRFQQQQHHQQQQQQHREDHSEHHHQQSHHPHRHQQQQQQQQQQHHYMKPESSQEPHKGMDDNNGDIVYIKEEPEDWPDPGEDEEPPEDATNMHPDSMFQSLVNPAAADTSSDDHNFSSLGWQNAPPPRPYRPRTSRTATVTSEVSSQGGAMAGAMEHNPDTQQDDEEEEQCVFAVYEDEVIPSGSNSKKSSIQTTMYFCQICGKSFGTLKSYNTHKDEHKGIFRHNCPECGEGYSTKAKFDAHMRKHTGEKFMCRVCGKSFTSKAGLVRHTKNMHSAQ